jgi:hypothetical protein
MEPMAARARDGEGRAFLGKVRYFSREKLLAHANAVFTGIEKPGLADFAATLLFKRAAFSHEAEIRLLYFDDPVECTELYSYPIDLLSIVNDILINPRLEVRRAEAIMADIRSRIFGTDRAL